MEIVLVSFVILFITAIGIFAIYKRSFNYWRQKGVYTPSPGYLLGNIKNIIFQKSSLSTELQSVYNHIKKRSLACGGICFFNKPLLVPVDLDLIKSILVTDFEHFTDRSFYTQDHDPLSINLFALKGNRWKQARAKLSPAFTASKNRLLIGTVSKHIDELLEIVDDIAEKRQKVNVEDLASRFSVDVIASCAFGFECNSLKDPNSAIKKIITKPVTPSIRNGLVFLSAIVAPRILSLFKIKPFQDEVYDFFIDLIEQTVKYRENNKVTRNDFLQLLLQIRNNVKSVENDKKFVNTPQLTMEEMAGHSMIFFLGGFETASSIITHSLYELARNPEIQEKARNEVQKCTQGVHLTYDALQNLQYLEKVIFEAIRMYPPLPMHFRECTKDYIIPNTKIKIEKGCSVLISVLGIQRDPKIYPNPDVFDPERFSYDNASERHSCAWSPFGIGPRTCIAYQFGMMEVKLVIASLLNRYRITLNSETKQPLEVNPKCIILFPKQEIWLNFTRL